MMVEHQEMLVIEGIGPIYAYAGDEAVPAAWVVQRLLTGRYVLDLADAERVVLGRVVLASDGSRPLISLDGQALADRLSRKGVRGENMRRPRDLPERRLERGNLEVKGAS